MSRIAVGLLGPITLTVDDEQVDLARRQVRGVLARLGLEVGRSVAVDTLIDALWEDQLPIDPVHALHVYVHRLRSAHEAMAGVIETTNTGYRLSLRPDDVDATRFAALLRLADKSGNLTERVAILDQALGLWRGAVCGSHQYAEFAVAASRHLEERMLVATELRYEALIALGETQTVLPDLRDLVVRYPYRDRFSQLLIEALRADGRELEALGFEREQHDRIRTVRTFLAQVPGRSAR